jgi:catecholate siderophore receptor
VFYSLNDRIRAQVNVENVLDEEYFAYAHNNNNITPGSPLAVRVGVSIGF